MRVRIRTKMVLMFTIVLAVVIGIELYAVAVQKKIREQSVAELKESSRIVEYSRLALLHFSRQVREWSNILLRGHDEEKYAIYLERFREEVRTTRAVTETLRKLVAGNATTSLLVEEFSQQHLALGKEYNAALEIFDKNSRTPHVYADQRVIGFERMPTHLLEEVVKLTLQDRDAKLLSMETTTADLEQRVQILILGTAVGSILLLLWLVDRLVGKPMVAATDIADRIARGDLSGPTEVQGSAEAHRLLGALQIMQRNLSESMESLERERNLFIAGPTVIFKWQFTDGWPVTYVSPNVTEQFGYSPDEMVSRQQKYFELLHPEDRIRILAEVNAYLQANTPVFEQEYRIVDTQGQYRWLQDLTVVERDASGEIDHLHGYVIDITRRKQAEVLEHQAFHDSLTGLPNRRLLEDRLDLALSYAGRHACLGAVFYLDLDGFKAINDSLGHRFGDELLKEVATRLKQSIRHEDTAARLGGDEFVVLLPQLGNDSVHALQQAETIAEKIREILACPYRIEAQELTVSSSIGVALFSGDHAGIDAVLGQADAAMYAAKKAGRNRIQLAGEPLSASDSA